MVSPRRNDKFESLPRKNMCDSLDTEQDRRYRDTVVEALTNGCRLGASPGNRTFSGAAREQTRGGGVTPW